MNYIYSGNIYHKRFSPKKHTFNYRVFCIYLDISNMDLISSKKIKLFSVNKFNIFSFFYKDHGPHGEKNVTSWIKKQLLLRGIKDKINKVFILCYPRILGYVFNPLSVYYCFGKDGKLKATVYEVHNTFKQRHFYILKSYLKNSKKYTRVEKAFHVSPFMKIRGTYSFKNIISKNQVSVSILYKGKEEGLFASFSGKKISFSDSNFCKLFFLYPLMTIKVILSIHYEAFFLLIKGLKFNKCPNDLKINITSNVKSKIKS